MAACGCSSRLRSPAHTSLRPRTDPSFRAALSDALAPAGMTVIEAEATPPSLGDLPAGSRELADREHAAGTVWLIGSPNGSTLVAYDRAVDRVLVRELPYTLPLASTQAAEAARMTRTMLRALHAMPESEQQKPPPPLPPPEAIAAPPPPRAPILAAGLAANVNFLAPGSDAIPASELSVIWRPQSLGLALSGSLAPSADLIAPAFDGSVRDWTLALDGRFPLRVSPHVTVSAELGAALHFVRIQGLLVDGEPVDTSSFDPAVRFRFAAGYSVRPDVEIGLGVAADTLLRRQMFDAGRSRIHEALGDTEACGALDRRPSAATAR